MSTAHEAVTKTPGTKSVYIGDERVQALKESAIELSYASKQQITASEIARFLHDHFLEDAKAKLLKLLKAA